MSVNTILAAVYAVVEQINAEIDVVFVEGKKDMEALEAAGVTCTILYPNHVHSITAGTVAAILTDFDVEGRKLHRRLCERLHGIAMVRGHIRQALHAALTPTGRRDIESITNLIVASDRYILPQWNDSSPTIVPPSFFTVSSVSS